ncbi:2-O-methyltransferase NoeI [Anatilimnocola aggregata]|uniref:2-O-methyltransferase NoeI n=1 Tax=Anatilimnocola aggregata TaxID=2528021 RepID=A0A517YBQ0_9BACT|nr:FkbM family methyltransferase [Anatilimnocola aggregata]QDU27670.1 2-O-methyltransferase NoeI [Anatilimnocola aggregata]
MSQLATATSADLTLSYRLPYWQKAYLPILRGPLTGSRWLPASGGKIVRLFCGTYEKTQSKLFQELIEDDAVVFDIGANVGYYTLLSARLASKGHVVAFEPEPRNIAFLRANVAANRCRNVSIHELAVAAEAGFANFQMGTGTGTGKLSNEGSLRVPMISLDEFVDQQQMRPTHMKIDVEGAEVDVLRGGRETLINCRPTIFLSTHGRKVHAACCEFLRELNYDLRCMDGGDLAEADSVLCTR